MNFLKNMKRRFSSSSDASSSSPPNSQSNNQSNSRAPSRSKKTDLPPGQKTLFQTGIKKSRSNDDNAQPINQSNNQSNSQSNNRSNDQSNNQSSNRSPNQPNKQLVDQLIKHNVAKHRFECGESFLAYEPSTSVITNQSNNQSNNQEEEVIWTIWETFVPKELRGQGLGDQLCLAAFDHVIKQSNNPTNNQTIKIIPECTFVAKFVESHSEYHHIIQSGNQSANQSTKSSKPRSKSKSPVNQSDKQSNNQSNNQSRSQSTRSANDPSNNLLADHYPLPHHPILGVDRFDQLKQSVTHYRETRQKIDQLINQSNNQSNNQKIEQMVTRSIIKLFSDLSGGNPRYQTVYQHSIPYLLEQLSHQSIKQSNNQTNNRSEFHNFVDHVIPFTISLIEQLFTLFPTASLPILGSVDQSVDLTDMQSSNQSSNNQTINQSIQSIDLTQLQSAALIACGLFSLHAEAPSVKQSNKQLKKRSLFNSVSCCDLFEELAHASKQSNNQSNKFKKSIKPVTGFQKLRCLFHYFTVLSKRDRSAKQSISLSENIITYVRRELADQSVNQTINQFKQSDAPLVPMHVFQRGTIEDDLPDYQSNNQTNNQTINQPIHLDFANKYIGGGVLSGGCVQEEILFLIHPDCLSALILFPVMNDRESILVIGCERFSLYQGYGGSFEWGGMYEDISPVRPIARTVTAGTISQSNDQSNNQSTTPSTHASSNEILKYYRRPRSILAVDALYYSDFDHQFVHQSINRELIKAFVGFSTPNSVFDFDQSNKQSVNRIISTGNWGCGVFHGDVPLKCIIQLLAASLSSQSTSQSNNQTINQSINYFTFGDPKCRGMESCYQSLQLISCSVKQLFEIVMDYSKRYSVNQTTNRPINLFQFIERTVETIKHKQSISQTNNQSDSQSNSHSMDQTFNQVNNQPIPVVEIASSPSPSPPVNTWTLQPITQSHDQTINQPINQSDNQMVDESQPMSLDLDFDLDESTDQPSELSIANSIDQSISPSIDQSNDQPIDQLTSRPITPNMFMEVDPNSQSSEPSIQQSDNQLIDQSNHQPNNESIEVNRSDEEPMFSDSLDIIPDSLDPRDD